MTEPKKSRYNWQMLKWGLIAQIIPAFFMVFVSLYLLQRTSMPFPLAFPLSIAWGAMGATIHYLSLKRGMKFRLWASIAFAVLTVGAGFGLAKGFAYDFSKLKECPVCGFTTLSEAGATCPLCYVKFDSVEAKKGGYASLDEYLAAEQIMFFQPKVGDTAVHFFDACHCSEEFPKSSTWRPSVTAQDVRDVQALVRDHSH